MAGSTFGTLFRVTTAGESHGPANVCIVDGCPAGLELSEADLIPDLERRRPGQSRIVSPRKEEDKPEILSGVFNGKTTGTPIAVMVRSTDQRSQDYGDIVHKYRPGHADYSFDAKYGFRDYRGGGRSSARETTARVCAGSIARKLLQVTHGIDCLGFVDQVGPVRAFFDHPENITLAQVEANPVRCPDPKKAEEMEAYIVQVRKEQDSIGGAAQIIAKGVPAGWGEPVFDKLKADLAKAMFSLPAVMGVEYGEGFGVTDARGTTHSDTFAGPKIHTLTNRHGGMLGGISTGMPIVMRCAVKPTSSILQERPTVDQEGNATTIATKGRHDPCLLPRFVPMAEAMMMLVLADHMLRQRAARI